jgi:8-oxo-dGTP pyrophosphatase MutT (NUDIX family)
VPEVDVLVSESGEIQGCAEESRLGPQDVLAAYLTALKMNGERRVLLLRRASFTRMGSSWHFFSGKLHKHDVDDEQRVTDVIVEEAVRRRLHEQLGLDTEVLKSLQLCCLASPIPHAGDNHRYLFYLTVVELPVQLVDNLDRRRMDPSIVDWRIVSIEDLPRIADEQRADLVFRVMVERLRARECNA